MKVKLVLYKGGYDEDDGDFDDYDDFLEKLDSEHTDTLEDMLVSHELTEKQAEENFDEFMTWYENMLKKYSCSCPQKAVVCENFCNYLDKNEPDEDDFYFWRLCLSDSNDLLFTEEWDKEDKLLAYFKLIDDIELIRFMFVMDKTCPSKFSRLISDITFCDDPVVRIEKNALLKELRKKNFNGDQLDDNLSNLCNKIEHSPELAALAPLVFYAALTRYRRKMLDTPGFEMNFSKAMRYMEYNIGDDNGKNLGNFAKHIELYILLRDIMLEDETDIYLNDYGFSMMSNICKCRLIDWKCEYNIIRPLQLELEDDYFTGFPNGLDDNPCGSVSIDDIMIFEDYDNKQPLPRRILDKIRDYIKNDSRIGSEYLELIRTDSTDECMPLVNRVLTESGIYLKGIKPKMIPLVNAIIMQEIMENISQGIQTRLIKNMSRFEKFIKQEELS